MYFLPLKEAAKVSGIQLFTYYLVIELYINTYSIKLLDSKKLLQQQSASAPLQVTILVRWHDPLYQQQQVRYYKMGY